MNKALLAVIAAAALGATKSLSQKGRGSFNDLSDKDVYDLVGNLNNIRSFEDFMAMDSEERERLRIQAGFLINEASSNPSYIDFFIKHLIANITTKIPITIYPKFNFIYIYLIIILFYTKQ